MSEKEIADLTAKIIEAKVKTEKNRAELDIAKQFNQDVKTANDSRIDLIKEENQRLDEELRIREKTLEAERKEIETSVYEAKTTLIRRVVLCSLKNALPQTVKTEIKNPLSIIYAGLFATVYDEITKGSKPVNGDEYKICIALSEYSDLSNHWVGIKEFLGVIWHEQKEIRWGYRDEHSVYFERDFSSEEEAKRYGERNRTKITQSLIDGIKQVENEISDANGDINEVFDFRMITDVSIEEHYHDRTVFKVESASKHTLILSPILSNYERTVDKTQPYQITVTQKDNVLTFLGHRYTGQARDIRDEINHYFHTDFKAVEADTNQEIPMRSNY